MKDLIEQYLADHKTAWAESTLRSETNRLRAIACDLDKAPSDLHRDLLLAGWKPYSIKTLFIRLVHMEVWALRAGLLKASAFKDYVLKHRNRFKHAYVKEDLEMTYDEALARIQRMTGGARTMALEMLGTGLRVAEVYTVKDGKVLGKGGKPRTVYGTITETVPRSTLSRQLKSVGLKPHTLRKLCATRLADQGATPADLCKIFGWTSIATAYQYLQPHDDARLAEMMSGKSIKQKAKNKT